MLLQTDSVEYGIVVAFSDYRKILLPQIRVYRRRHECNVVDLIASFTRHTGECRVTAEIDLNVLSGQPLKDRIAEISVMRNEVKAWESPRNALKAEANWQFTTEDARIKLNQFYPALGM